MRRTNCGNIALWDHGSLGSWIGRVEGCWDTDTAVCVDEYCQIFSPWRENEGCVISHEMGGVMS